MPPWGPDLENKSFYSILLFAEYIKYWQWGITVIGRPLKQWWINNSTNTNEANSDLSSQVIEHIKRSRHMMLEIQVIRVYKDKECI